MPKKFTISAKHMAGGLNLAAGERFVKEEESVFSQHMEFSPAGSAVTSLGWASYPSWDFDEDGHGIDGMFASANYPDLLFVAVNGKIKVVDNTTGTPYNVDTGLSLTAGEPVMFREYRGMIYYCNGVDDMGMIAVGLLQNSESAGSSTWELGDAEGYKFANTTDKVYCEGDEIDYTGVSTDDLTGVTNGLAHSAGAVVTQHNAISEPPSPGSIKARSMAMWRDTMWIAGMPDEPNVLRYSKTISSVGGIAGGDIHDFSDENNYLIGEGGAITALQSTRDRLYVFMKDRVHYITTEFTSTGTLVFSPDRLFTGNYGCPNPFCVAEMEDVVVFFTGKRVIRVGYAPSADQILPDEKFDEEIYPILAQADADQTGARVVYHPAKKELRVTFKIGGVLRTAKYNYRLDKWSYPDDTDLSCYGLYKDGLYFGDPDDDNVWKIGLDIDGNSSEVPHVLKTGRLDGGDRKPKMFIRGMVEGKKSRTCTINMVTAVNGKDFGGIRRITDAHADFSTEGTALGDVAVGTDVIGGEAAGVQLFDYKYPFIIRRLGEDIQLRWSSLEEGATWTVDKWHVEGIGYDQISSTHY